ncbi:MAG: flavodoxin family protein, partial [Clostridiales bacterium]
MKVILLSGSPKSEGNTMQVLESCRKVIENEGLEAKVLSLSGKKIEGCIACNYCKSHNGCSLQDDFQTIVEEIRDADGFIIGSPVYFGTARGEVMSFLQRLGMVSKSNGLFLENMVGGPIVVA